MWYLSALFFTVPDSFCLLNVYLMQLVEKQGSYYYVIPGNDFFALKLKLTQIDRTVLKSLKLLLSVPE